MDPISRDDLTAALASAFQPLLTEMKEMRGDIQSLKLTAAPRTDVYSRDVMDEKLGTLEQGIESINKALLANRDFTWKVVGAGFSVAMLLVYLAPHLIWH